MSDQSRRSASGYDLSPLSAERRAAREATLTPDERRVILNAGTEMPFCGGLLKNASPGVYVCRLCELPLFRSSAKFESRTGWPSFFEPFDPEHVASIRDTSHGMTRVETRCARCGGHLGHVFEDGPVPTGLRYCMNSAALAFTADEK